MKRRLKLPKFFLEFTGNTYVCSNPLFFHYKPHHHKVTGLEVRLIIQNLQAGDILLRRYDGYLNSILTTLASGSFWGHAALAVDKDTVVHAVSQGVIYEDILEFSRCDSLCILRPRVSQEAKDKAVAMAHQFIREGWQYDYEFEMGNGKLYCCELPDATYDNMFRHEFSMEMGNYLLIPDNIFNSEHVDKVLVIKH